MAYVRRCAVALYCCVDRMLGDAGVRRYRTWMGVDVR